jgi:hypothetical protein
MTTIQPIVDDVFDKNQQSVSAKNYFIDGLLVDVVRKVTRTIPKLISQPNLLSHTIHELLQFDQSLQDDFGFVPPPSLEMARDNNTSPLQGQVTDIVLSNPTWFEAWFEAERRCK